VTDKKPFVLSIDAVLAKGREFLRRVDAGLPMDTEFDAIRKKHGIAPGASLRIKLPTDHTVTTPPT
jgi:hypothetical protein